jgi:hypothetical protein
LHRGIRKCDKSKYFFLILGEIDSFMENLEIKATHDTPHIFCDISGEVLLEGRSLPENPLLVYEQVFRWAEKYDKTNITIIFRLEYFNTSSSKQIFTLIKSFHSNPNVKAINVKWYFEEGDYDSHETGEHYSHLFKIPFEFIEYKENI